jgi:sirohydrochlorin cobaltochelatase
VVGELARSGIASVTVVPMFLGTGRHAREDLPEIMAVLAREHPAMDFRLQRAVGEDHRVLALLAEIAREE